METEEKKPLKTIEEVKIAKIRAQKMIEKILFNFSIEYGLPTVDIVVKRNQHYKNDIPVHSSYDVDLKILL